MDTGASRPVSSRPYRQDPIKSAAIAGFVEELEAHGLISKSDSPWSSPVLLVRKKPDSAGVRAWRMCIDYSRLNHLTSVLGYAPPLTADLLDRGAGKRWYASLDLSAAFWQQELAAEDSARTAFDAGGQRYQWARLPFGLANAPAAFAKALEEALRPVLQEQRGSKDSVVLTYADDLLIGSQCLFDAEVAGGGGGGGGSGGGNGGVGERVLLVRI